jgi:hypothetical protein
MTDLDPAVIMAEHRQGPPPLESCMGCEWSEWPCLPYRLAAALAEAQERERRVRAMMGRALADIQAQREANHIRWGDKSIENRPPDYEGWLPTLGEEFGEICRALCLEGERTRLRSELIDLVAVGLMWLDSIDRAVDRPQRGAS